jgi:hypothetical protein
MMTMQFAHRIRGRGLAQLAQLVATPWPHQTNFGHRIIVLVSNTKIIMLTRRASSRSGLWWRLIFVYHRILGEI